MSRKPVLLGWGVRREGRSLWTRNANRGVSIRGERRKRDGRVEWRQWRPSKSKVAAALIRTKGNPSDLLPATWSVQAMACNLCCAPYAMQVMQSDVWVGIRAYAYVCVYVHIQTYFLCGRVHMCI